MLTSLFGELSAKKAARKKQRQTSAPPDLDQGFAATAIMQSTATEMNERGQMIDRYSHDLVVSGSPAHAIRDHFASTRADLETATSLITILDPVGVWGSAVIKALSDASGRPVERLHLREQHTLRTLATIERTTVVRRQDETLRIYHAEVRAPGRDTSEIPAALMERSQLSTVVIGPMQVHLMDTLLQSLLDSVSSPRWRCPNLLFMLPPNASWIASKIGAVAWPEGLNLYQISESMTGASAVWNAILGVWNQIKQQPGWKPSGPMGLTDNVVARTAGDRTVLPPMPTLPTPQPEHYQLDTHRAQEALAGLLKLEGFLGGAIVDVITGMVLLRETPTATSPVDMDVAAAASAQVLRAHRRGARIMGLSQQIEEVISSSSDRVQIMRMLSSHAELFLVTLLERQHANLALARFQIMEADRSLVSSRS